MFECVWVGSIRGTNIQTNTQRFQNLKATIPPLFPLYAYLAIAHAHLAMKCEHVWGFNENVFIEKRLVCGIGAFCIGKYQLVSIEV